MIDLLKDYNIGLPLCDSASGKPVRVVAAMSGGVDSCVSAALCHALGYEVVGVTLQLYDDGGVNAGGNGKACCAGRDIHDAKQVAEAIGFPHYVLNYQSRFRQAVIDDFADSYLRGETPVPCIRCNQTVKFADLLAVAQDLSAQALITGHYVRRREIAGKVHLLTGRDECKDQSYFLFATSASQLDFLHFPLGDLLKLETRQLASYFGLRVAEKRESQDICFVGEGKYGDLLMRLRPEGASAGDIVHIEDGRILGRHAGIMHYTVGQRRGLGIGGRSDDSEALYVVRLEPDSRRVVVGERHYLGIDGVVLKEVNWLGDEDFARLGDRRLRFKIRSNMEAVGGYLSALENGGAVVRFDRCEYGVSRGQACVFYDGQRVLGGGWIDSTDSTNVQFMG